MSVSILEKAIIEELKKLGVKRPKVVLEHPTDPFFGDYSTNIAMVYAKKLGFSPIDLAGEIVAGLKKHQLEQIEKITVAGFGFINFYLKADFFTNQVQKIIEDKDFGKNNSLKKQKIIVEYTDANPFKIFHIGHLMSNSIGESTARILEWNGAEVKRASYQGDVGIHIAKAIYGIKQKAWQFWWEKIFGNDLSRVDFLGRSYALGAKLFEEDEEVKKQITDLNKLIYDRSKKSVNKLYDLGKKWSLDYFESIYKILGSKFDLYFFESEVAPAGVRLVNDFLSKKVFEKSDEAIVFKGESFGLHTRVFLNSKGLPTYEAKELALAKEKYDRFAYDRSIVLTGNEITEYFKVIKKAMDFIFPDLAVKTEHLPHGMLKLPSGKMSSRTGKVIPAIALLDDVQNKVLEKLADRDIKKGDKPKIARVIAVGAVKFAILRQSPGRDIVFDLDKSISFEGDSGPYLQYTVVRINSLLKKAEAEGIKINFTKDSDDISLLEKTLYQFPEVISRAEIDKAPHYIVTYLLELASAFNSFYGENKIINPTSKEVSGYRLALAEATKVVMKNGLTILGIKIPKQM